MSKIVQAASTNKIVRNEIKKEIVKVQPHRRGVAPDILKSREEANDKKSTTSTTASSDPRLLRLSRAKISERKSQVSNSKNEDINDEIVEEEEKEINEEQSHVMMTSDDESEESSDESMRMQNAVLMKPVFVSKKIRDKMSNNEISGEDLEDIAEVRKKEALIIVADHVRKEILGENIIINVNELDDTDNPNDVENEYNAWRIRNADRKARERMRRKELLNEMKILEKRRLMTDEERKDDDLLNNIDRFRKERPKQKFLQKYFHKGAFYNDEVKTVLERDFSQPTLEDHFNRDVLPEVLQVKNFGKAGRSKWTHLSKEDTTDRKSGWNEFSSSDVKNNSKQSDVFERPGSLKYKKRKT
jgi:microfibrillar-associated protein 1